MVKQGQMYVKRSSHVIPPRFPFSFSNPKLGVTASPQATKQKRSTEGCFEFQRSRDKTSPGEIGLDIRTHASPKVGQDQVSGGVSIVPQINSIYQVK